MELFQKLFGELLLFVYHCFDRIVINGYLSGLSRPEQVVHFFRQVLGVPILSKELIAQRTNDYQKWVEAFGANHQIPIQWAEKGYQVPGSHRSLCRTSGSMVKRPRGLSSAAAHGLADRQRLGLLRGYKDP